MEKVHDFLQKRMAETLSDPLADSEDQDLDFVCMSTLIGLSESCERNDIKQVHTYCTSMLGPSDKTIEMTVDGNLYYVYVWRKTNADTDFYLFGCADEKDCNCFIDETIAGVLARKADTLLDEERFARKVYKALNPSAE